MNKFNLEPLSSLLGKVINSPYGIIYLQGSYPWKNDTLGIIYLTDRYHEKTLETEHPDFFRENNLQYVMQIDRAEDALQNAFMQKEDVSLDELVECFNFHYKHSGYLKLS